MVNWSVPIFLGACFVWPKSPPCRWRTKLGQCIGLWWILQLEPWSWSHWRAIAIWVSMNYPQFMYIYMYVCNKYTDDIVNNIYIYIYKCIPWFFSFNLSFSTISRWCVLRNTYPWMIYRHTPMPMKPSTPTCARSTRADEASVPCRWVSSAELRDFRVIWWSSTEILSRLYEGN